MCKKYCDIGFELWITRRWKISILNIDNCKISKRRGNEWRTCEPLQWIRDIATCSLIKLPKSDTSQSNRTMGFVMIDRNPFWNRENAFWMHSQRA